MPTKPVKRIYMRELADILDRSSHTIRCWESDGMLPKWLIPKRDHRDWRYWTERQVEGLKEWMSKNGMAPGKGLSGFQPDGTQVQGMLEQLRKPRDLELVQCPKCPKKVKNLAAHTRLAHPSRRRKQVATA